MKYDEIVEKIAVRPDKEDMRKLTCMTNEFVEQMREKYPEKVEAFLEDIAEAFCYFLTDREAKRVVDNMKNESPENPEGQKWDKATTLKVFSDAGHPLHNERYSENGVFWAMNMVYSDFFPMYKEDVSKYVEHAFLFLNDKDYCGKYSKEKWFAKKGA